jgi:hypothetical protein
MRTKTDEELERSERAFSDDPERQEALRRTRRFKASWIELAEILAEIRKESRWRDWGHDSFESYTRRELKLRAATVDKLLGSYAFLRKRAPKVLERDGMEQEIPSYQAVDFLRRASEEVEDAPEEIVEEVFHKVIDEGAGAGQVAREYGAVLFPVDPDVKKQRDIAAVRNVAKRLYEILGETEVVSKPLASAGREALGRILEALEPKQQEAA